MNTNMTGFGKSLRPCSLEESSLSIGRVEQELFEEQLNKVSN